MDTPRIKLDFGSIIKQRESKVGKAVSKPKPSADFFKGGRPRSKRDDIRLVQSALKTAEEINSTRPSTYREVLERGMDKRRKFNVWSRMIIFDPPQPRHPLATQTHTQALSMCSHFRKRFTTQSGLNETFIPPLYRHISKICPNEHVNMQGILRKPFTLTSQSAIQSKPTLTQYSRVDCKAIHLLTTDTHPSTHSSTHLSRTYTPVILKPDATLFTESRQAPLILNPAPVKPMQLVPLQPIEIEMEPQTIMEVPVESMSGQVERGETLTEQAGRKETQIEQVDTSEKQAGTLIEHSEPVMEQTAPAVSEESIKEDSREGNTAGQPMKITIRESTGDQQFDKRVTLDRSQSVESRKETGKILPMIQFPMRLENPLAPTTSKLTNLMKWKILTSANWRLVEIRFEPAPTHV